MQAKTYKQICIETKSIFSYDNQKSHKQTTHNETMRLQKETNIVTKRVCEANKTNSDCQIEYLSAQNKIFIDIID